MALPQPRKSNQRYFPEFSKKRWRELFWDLRDMRNLILHDWTEAVGEFYWLYDLWTYPPDQAKHAADKIRPYLWRLALHKIMDGMWTESDKIRFRKHVGEESIAVLIENGV